VSTSQPTHDRTPSYPWTVFPFTQFLLTRTHLWHRPRVVQHWSASTRRTILWRHLLVTLHRSAPGLVTLLLLGDSAG
jgi:hypothetical protein